MAFLLLKWVHVLAAIVAVGSNLTYGIWIARASRDPSFLPFALRGVKFIDDRLANPAFILLLITGLTMTFVLPLPLTTPWVLTAIILYAFLIVLGLFGYTPTLRRQIQVLDSEGITSSNYQALARRGAMLGAVLAVIVTVIVFLMVVKPGLWT